MTLEQAYELALQHHQSGRLREAESLYRQILAHQPNHTGATQMLGVLAHQMGRNQESLELLNRAISLDPNQASCHGNIGLVLANLGRFDEAIASYRRAIALQPDYGQAHANLAFALTQKGQLDDAIAAFQRALEIHPKDADAHHNLGGIYRRQGRAGEAIAAYRRAIALRPGFAEAHYNLANALKDQGETEDAIRSYRTAIEARPNFPEACNNLGNALIDLGRTDQAIESYRLAIAQRPEFVDAHFNLGNALSDAGRPDEVIAAFRKAIELRPNHAEAYSNLGKVLKDTGALDEAIDCYRRAIAIDPNSPATDNLLFALYLHPQYTAQQIYEEHARWNQTHAAPLAASFRRGSKGDETGRRLRIGYVSPDFRNHVVGLNILPLLREHDHESFEVFCYSNVPRPDSLTARFRSYADSWREIRNLSDEQAAALIREDGIDILIDLALHSAHNRLLVFARKPAPVQATFAGYPGTTGLTTIDYRLSDPYLDPPGMSDACYSETTLRLPDSFWCYEASSEEPGVNPLPAASSGAITFGCLNRFCKINPPVLRLWARALNAVPNSRLLLLSTHGSHRQRAVAHLASEGVEPRRVEFVDLQPREQYLRTYHRIDIGLDTSPYNGHTTSLDSFWMGVPVVTRIGETAVARAGWCQLSNLGLGELAGRDDDDFVRITTQLAHDPPRLAMLRSTLRDRMKRSPLMDAKRFTQAVESAYRQMRLNIPRVSS